MKIFLALCLVGLTTAFPFNGGVKPKTGNPDEWGPYFGGDMKFKNSNDQKNGIIDTSYRWPNAQMAYSWDSSIDSGKQAVVLQAMNDFVTSTSGCISFVERTTESNYVLFTGFENDGCFSYVGMVGGEQQLNYPQWCIDQYGSVQHEQLHAFGFYHEQSSPDRDSYVTIMWDNIQAGAAGNFVICDYDECTTFNTVYDYGSVMHYSKTAFSKNGENTIVTLDASQQDVIGQRVGFSATDTQKLMSMYNC